LTSVAARISKFDVAEVQKSPGGHTQKSKFALIESNQQMPLGIFMCTGTRKNVQNFT